MRCLGKAFQLGVETACTLEWGSMPFLRYRRRLTCLEYKKLTEMVTEEVEREARAMNVNGVLEHIKDV